MHRLCRHAADSENGGEEIGAGSQVLYGTEKLHAVPLLLQGIVRSGSSLHGDLPGLQLKGLFCLRGQHQGALDNKGGAHVLLCYLLIVFKGLPLKDHLQGLEAAAVVQLYKTEVLHIPDSSHPAADSHLLSAQALAVGKNSRYSLTLHMALILSLSTGDLAP